MKSLFILLLLITLPAHAIDRRHMVTLGSEGLAWTGSYEHMDTRKESPFKSVNSFLSNLSLNYAYRFDNRFQLGAYFQSYNGGYHFKNRDGKTAPSEVEVTAYGIFGLYNLNEDIKESWFLGYSFGILNREEENSHDLETAEDKAPFELDDVSQLHELLVDKRFSLHWMRLEYLSYSPTIRLFYKTHGKDLDDQSVKNGVGATIQPIRFDLFF